MSLVMKTPLQFLMDTCKCGDGCNINYKPYEYGSLVESIHIKEAEQRLVKDIEELKEFGSAFPLNVGLDEFAVKTAYSIWEKHLIVY